MALNNILLGELIEPVERYNSELKYGVDDVRGVSNTKGMIETHADMSSRTFEKFYIVAPNEFVFNRRTTRNGERLGLAFNDTNRDYIFTNDYVVFKVKDDCKDKLDATYLYMFFLRDEFDRYVRYCSWGSATEFFNWEEMQAVPISLPDIKIQRKYVAIYNAMQKNQHSYECGLEDFKLVIDSTLDHFKTKSSKMTIGEMLEEVDIRNSKNEYSNVMGINIQKQFMPSNLTGSDKFKYKIVVPGQFAYSSMQTGRDKCIRIALLLQESPVIVSPAYSILRMKTSSVLAKYIMMWFSRQESDRYGWFLSDGSVRANLDLPVFFDIKIPVPSLSEQQSLVDLYDVYIKRRELNERLKSNLKALCPILIRGAITEAEATA